jgi:hypothetical protein
MPVIGRLDKQVEEVLINPAGRRRDDPTPPRDEQTRPPAGRTHTPGDPAPPPDDPQAPPDRPSDELPAHLL